MIPICRLNSRAFFFIVESIVYVSDVELSQMIQLLTPRLIPVSLLESESGFGIVAQLADTEK
jgi:hypothetical protein